MPAKRPIAALELPGIKPGLPPTKTPEITWMEPGDLLVDESYQRGVGEKGIRLIRRIVETFDWRRFKPPTAVWTDQGLEVVDGQHSAIAAASHPEIGKIPVVVVEGADLADRAAAFIGINRDRLNVTQMQIHAAGIVAGDATAMEIEAVSKSAGLRILRSSPSNGVYQPRDTVAVRTIGELIRRRGTAVASEVMKVVCCSDPAPVTSNAIRAVDFLMHDEEHASAFDLPELKKAILALGTEADREAGVFAAEHCVPKWRGLAAVWFRKTRRRKPRGEAAAGSEPSEPSPEPIELSAFLGDRAPRRRIIVRHQPQSYDFGDPPPERSAQRAPGKVA